MQYPIMKQFNFEIEDELLIKFKEKAIKEGKKYSQILRELNCFIIGYCII